GGGAGPSGQGTGWASPKGFGLNANPGVGFNSTDGNDYVDSVLDPGDSSLFRVVTALPAAITTNFHVTASSTIALGEGLKELTTTGSLTLDAGVTLSIDPAQAVATATFGNTVLNGDATIELLNG